MALLATHFAAFRHALAAPVTAAMTVLAALAAGLTRFFGCELVCCATSMSRLAALATAPPRFFRSEFGRRAFLMGGVTAHAGDLTLLLWIHRCKAAIARAVFVALAACFCVLFTRSTAGILISSHYDFSPLNNSSRLAVAAS